jgi:CheY-like chemotaxis protein
MSSIAIVHGIFCNEEEILRTLTGSLNLKNVTTGDMVQYAAKVAGMTEEKIAQAFSAKTSVFNRFTHEKERALSYLRLGIAERLVEDNLLIIGMPALLIPRRITHVLSVCLISSVKERVKIAVEQGGLTETEALKRINREEADYTAWVSMSRDVKDPWGPEMYDIILPMEKTEPGEAVKLIEKNAWQPALQPTDESRRAVQDFLLAARVEVALAREGHVVSVEANGGEVTLTTNKKVLMLSRLKEELKGIASGVKGVETVITKVGKKFHQADIYRKFDFQMPSKVLLVDDEREFVQTLSERLQMRDVGSAVAYDGQSAIDLINSDEPEVMILDLKMPGIDGIEVLRRTKATQPHIEVIILTGHGSEEDRKTCMELGAYAYIHKPVDIDLLSKTLKEAYEKIKIRRGSS